MTINEDILDASIRHMVWLERYKTGTVNDILKLLNKVDKDLIEQIERRLIKIEQRGFDLGKQTTERLKSLQSFISKNRVEAFKTVYTQSKDELISFAAYESDFNARVIESSAAIVLDRPSAVLVRAVVTSDPFRGRLLKDWFSGLEQGSARRINDAIQIGIVEGQTTAQIMQRIRGTRARRYKDGVLEMSRRDTSTIVRTAIAHVQDRAKSHVWDANRDIIEGLKWVSTLDGRTSPICRERDGKIYEIDKVPPTPAHFNCRSTTVPYLGELFEGGTRASVGGQVPKDVKYGDWLRKQPKSVQEEVLGVRKAKLFNEGGLSIDRFQDSTGKTYTLDELRKRDADVFNNVFGGVVAKSKAQRMTQEAEFREYIGKKTYPKLRDEMNKAVSASGINTGKLSEAEKVAVHAYTRGEGYFKRLNNALRSGKAERIADVSPMANVLDNALSKIPEHRGTVYRTTNLPDNVAKDIVAGNEYVDQAFMSTTQNDLGKSFGDQYKLIIADSVSGREIKGYSEYWSEGEVLFPRQTKFDILHVEHNKDTGLIEVILHEQTD